jgi:starvation-inducible DNA-binding protein
MNNSTNTLHPMKSITGIEEQASQGLVTQLNQLLADYQIYYQNLRGFHWNISGPGFFELHRHFETLYTAAQLTIDELAERILTLGGRPLHTMSDYVHSADIKESRDVYTADETVRTTLKNIEVLLHLEREIVIAANEAGDEGTADLLTPLIAAQEKQAWMLKAYLGR